MAGELRADHGGDRVIGAEKPGQVRIHAKEDGDAVEIQEKRERDAEQRVQPEKRRKTEKHAERKGCRRPLRRVVDVQQLVEPATDKRERQVDHRK